MCGARPAIRAVIGVVLTASLNSRTVVHFVTSPGDPSGAGTVGLGPIG